MVFNGEFTFIKKKYFEDKRDIHQQAERKNDKILDKNLNPS